MNRGGNNYLRAAMVRPILISAALGAAAAFKYTWNYELAPGSSQSVVLLTEVRARAPPNVPTPLSLSR